MRPGPDGGVCLPPGTGLNRVNQRPVVDDVEVVEDVAALAALIASASALARSAALRASSALFRCVLAAGSWMQAM